MAARRSYWSMYRRARARFDFVADEARLFVALFPFPYAIDIDRHPRIAARIAREVRLRLVREDVDKLKRELEKAPRQLGEPPPPLEAPSVEWEVTIHYTNEELDEDVDVTCRVLAPWHADREHVKRAFWAFVNQRTMTHYQLLGTVDWRRVVHGKRGSVEYENSGGQANLLDFKSMFFRSAIRIAPVEES